MGRRTGDANRCMARLGTVLIGVSVATAAVVLSVSLESTTTVMPDAAGGHAQPVIGLAMPLWAWLLTGAGLVLALVFGLAPSPARAVGWAFASLGVLFVLQLAGLVQLHGSLSARAPGAGGLAAVWVVQGNWLVMGLLLVAALGALILQWSLRDRWKPRGGRPGDHWSPRPGKSRFTASSDRYSRSHPPDPAIADRIFWDSL